MADKDFEIVVKYQSWQVNVFDKTDKQLAELIRKSEGWFSPYWYEINANHKVYSLTDAYEGRTITHNNTPIGSIEIGKFEWFGKVARIELEEQNYVLTRKGLLYNFTVTDAAEKELMTIELVLYPKKQFNLFRFIYFPTTSYYSVFLSEGFTVTSQTPLLLTIFGYCARLFTEIDSGDYAGKVVRTD